MKHLIVLFLLFVGTQMDAQATITLQGINQGSEMPIISAQMQTAQPQGGGRSRASSPAGNYFLVQRNMDSSSSTISNYSQKGKLIRHAVIRHTLGNGSTAEEHLTNVLISQYSQSIGASGSTESFRVFYQDRETKQ
jgi:type VI protein secretion system component Hcp